MVFPTAKGPLSIFFPILYSESFILFKKAVYNGLSLELNIPFVFQLRTESAPLSFLILMYQVVVDKQMCFEIHHY